MTAASPSGELCQITVSNSSGSQRRQHLGGNGTPTELHCLILYTGGDMVSTQVVQPEVHAEDVAFPSLKKATNLNIVANDENYALAA